MINKLRAQRAALADFGLFTFQFRDLDALLTRGGCISISGLHAERQELVGPVRGYTTRRRDMEARLAQPCPLDAAEPKGINASVVEAREAWSKG